MTSELRRSALRGSVQRWWVADSYKVTVGKFIEPTGEFDEHRWHDRHPFAFQELPIEFAKLKDGDPQAMLDFVSKYGLLGHQNLDAYESFRDEEDEDIGGKTGN